MSETPKPEPDVAEYPNGGVKYAGFKLAGAPHGDWSWYRLDGSLMRSGSFERGRQVGIWRTFDRSGRLVKETTFPGPPSGT